MCLDQMGLVAVKSYPGKHLVKPEATAATPAGRAKQEIDYGRREKAGYVFGALQPRTGEVFTATYTRRTLVNWIDFLHQVEEWIPQEVERVYAVLVNLTMHRAVDVLLFNLAYPRLQVRVSAYLCGVLKSDRALVENPQIAGAQRTALRNLERGRGGGAKGDGVLECTQASVCVGPPQATSSSAQAWHCSTPQGRMTLLVCAIMRSAEQRLARICQRGGLGHVPGSDIRFG